MEAELMRSTSDVSKSSSGSSCGRDEEDGELRRGPWAVEEDTLLVHCIASHGEGRWNLIAKSSGLRRSGKSCRLRWLNYLKPEVKRGNLTPEEQLLILELHSKWGNRWSKIAQHLPGRTDNEIKNYWRTRVQKQARHLNIDPNSSAFEELIRRFWMPRLLQKIQGRRPSPSPSTLLSQNLPTSSPPPINHPLLPPPPGGTFSSNQYVVENSSSEHGASPTVSSFEHPETPFQAAMDNFDLSAFLKGFCNVEDMTCDIESFRASSMEAVPWGLENSISGYHVRESNNWIDHDEIADNLWNLDEVWPSSNQGAGRMGQ